MLRSMKMAEIKVHAGDFRKGGGHSLMLGSLIMRTPKHWILGETIPLTELAEVDVASEESVKRFGGTVGWGIAGSVLFGPVGLLAGVLVGGRGKEVTFIAKLKDGRKMLATTDSKTFTKLQAAVFE